MADHRHKRDTDARRKPRAALVAGPLALVATASVVTLGVLASSPTSTLVAEGSSADLGAAVQPRDSRESASRSGSRLGSGIAADRLQSAFDRNASRTAATARAVATADARLWTTADLNLWTTSGPDADNVGELAAGKKVLVTGRKADGRTEVVVAGTARWVTSGYLSSDKPATLGGACTNGTSVPSGVSPNIVKVHQAVCAAFPEISVYGTFRGDGEHSQGIAVDIMVSGERGWQVAEFVRENYAALGVSYLIYSQKIWSVERGGEGWRGLADRGSATANHYDHVHVTTY